MSIFSSSSGSVSHNRQTHGRGRQGRAAPRSLPATRDGQEPTTEGKLTNALMAALFSLPITMVLSLLLLFIVTAVAYAHADPDSLTTPLALGVLGVSSLLCGLIAARRGHGRPMLAGLLAGLLYTLALWGLSLCFGDEARTTLTLGLSAPAAWGLHGIALLLSLLGGKLGSHRPQKQRRKHGVRR